MTERTVSVSPSPLTRKCELLQASPLRQYELQQHTNSVFHGSIEASSAFTFTKQDPILYGSVLDLVADDQAAKALEMYSPPAQPTGLFNSTTLKTQMMGYRLMFNTARNIAKEAQAECLQNILNRDEYARAGKKHPSVKRVVSAPTARVEDHPLTNEGFKMLIEALLKAEDGQGAIKLRQAIEQGPDDGDITFDPPKDIYQTVASVVRWLLLDTEKKSRIRPSDAVREDIWKMLDSEGYERKIPMVGGVAAFCSLLLVAQGHDAVMYNEGHMITQIGGYFSPDFKVFSDDPSVNTMQDILAKNAKSSPGHFSISFSDDSVLSALGTLILRRADSLAPLRIDTSNVQCVGRDMIISGTTCPIGFSESIPDHRLIALSKDSDLVLLSGFQYPTSNEEYDHYFRFIELNQKTATPIAIEYSEPKCIGTDTELYGLVQLKKNCISAIGFNTSEARDLLKRLKKLHDQPLSDDAAQYVNQLGLDEDFWRMLDDTLARVTANAETKRADPDKGEAPWLNSTEDSIWMYDAARVIQKLTGIPWVRVRGQYADVTYASPDAAVSDPAEVRKHLYFSRQQAALKSINERGYIRDVDSQMLLEPIPTDASLASNARLGNKISNENPEALGVLNNLALRWYTKMPSGHYVFLAIPHEFICETQKNTVSAGDTMAATLWSGISDMLQDTHKNLLRKHQKTEGLPSSIFIG